MDFNRKHKYLIQILPFSQDFYIDQEMKINNVYYEDGDLKKRDYYLENLEKNKNGVKFIGYIRELYYPFMLLDEGRLWTDMLTDNNEYYKFFNIEKKQVIEAPISHVRILRDFTKDEEELSKMFESGVNIGEKEENTMDEISKMFETGLNVNKRILPKTITENIKNGPEYKINMNKNDGPVIEKIDKNLFYNGVQYEPEDYQYVENLKKLSRKKATNKLPKLNRGILKSGVLKSSKKTVTKKNVEKNIKKVEKKTKRSKK